MKQLPNLKAIHVRKVEDALVELVCERRKKKIDYISKGDVAEHSKAVADFTESFFLFFLWRSSFILFLNLFQV